MDASKFKYLLREASSESSLTTTRATVVGAVILIAASQAFAQTGAEPPANVGRTFQPQVYDFTWKNRQKAETKRLLQDAREAAAQGQTQKARGLLQKAAELPINWDLDEASPQALPPERDDQPSDAELPAPGRRFADVPTVSELAIPSTDEDEQVQTLRESFQRRSQRKTSMERSADSRDDRLSSPPQRHSADSSHAGREESDARIAAEQPKEVDHVNLDHGHKASILQAVPTTRSADNQQDRATAATTAFGTTASNSTAPPEQALVSYSIIVLSALFGAVVVLIGLLLFLLKKFGPNPTFVFKVEMTNTGRDAVSNERPAPPPPLRIAPIYAMRMQEEAEREQQQEEAMMRRVFEDNLELRDQLQAAQNAA